ncbi:hypothetical protein [Streptomyces sp. CAU 1734]|uniref:hypothetical protein n=1 Tax=Streptomyces sp. CAU 1734 TaxID=3140360 RepID=UPI00326126BA
MSADRNSCERYGPDGPPDDRTGNGIVKNGPENAPHGHDGTPAAESAAAPEPARSVDAAAPADPVTDSAGPGAGPAEGAAESAAGGPAEEAAGGEAGPDRGVDPDQDTGPDRGAGPASGPAGGEGALLSALFGGSAGGGGGGGRGAGFGAGGDGGGDGPHGEEESLRRLLQGAVGDLAPADGALDHLRKAVPARRARKRQALVGMAAAVVLIGTAVPAFVHVANSGGGTKADPITMGNTQHATGGNQAEPGAGTESRDPAGPTAGASGKPGGPDNPSVPPGEKPGPGQGDGDGGRPHDRPNGGAPTPLLCAPDQLQTVSAQSGVPDGEGKVYGSFRVSNVSGSSCTVSGGGTVDVLPMGAADAAKISVVHQSPGDAASGLPDPSESSSDLLLAPSASYEVRFAWVPSETCPTTGASPEPTPSGEPPTGETGGGFGTAPGGITTQLVRADGLQDGSISVSHTAPAGSPTAATDIANACAGTVYRTGLLAAG